MLDFTLADIISLALVIILIIVLYAPRRG